MAMQAEEVIPVTTTTVQYQVYRRLASGVQVPVSRPTVSKATAIKAAQREVEAQRGFATREKMSVKEIVTTTTVALREVW